jgi:hypothetical protein
MSRLLLFASVILTNISPPVGQIGANYFDTLKQSQVWVNVEPRMADPSQTGPAPVEMNFTVAFPGRSVAAQPMDVALRVQAYCLRFPTRVRVPELALEIDGAEIRFGSSGVPFTATATCTTDSTAIDVVAARIPFDMLGRLIRANRVNVHALGFDLVLTPDDQRALARFAEAVSDGVTVK